MIQIYAIGNRDFDWNGDAVIDAISCESDTTIGGSWELELVAPIDDDGDFNYIQVGAVISVPSPSGGKDLLWSIYDREKSDQSVTAKARPIFMDAAKDVFLMDVRPVNMRAQQALDKMMAGTKYSGVTDITAVNTSYYIRKNLIEALASDDDNSFVNRWGGEISYENFTVHVMSRLGEDRGLRVEFGRNIESISEKENNEELATRLVPVSYNGYTLPGDKPWVDSPRINDYPIIHTRLLECKDLMLRADLEASGDNPDDPGEGNIVFDTLAELQQAMRERCMEAFADGIDVPQMTYNVDMVDLSDKEEYQDYKDLEKVLLGDTVHYRNKRLSIQRDARVIRVRFDHIRMVNTELTIGDYDGDYFARLQNLNKKVEQTEDDLHQLQIEFSIVNGKITSRIWQEDIDVAVDGLSASVDEKFSTVTQSIDEISTEVGEIKTVQDEHGRQIEETKSSITQTADKIRAEVSETYSTKQETTEKVEAAQGAAEGYTDEKLKSYSTTTEMQSAIKQRADAIELEVRKKVGADEIISSINQSAEEIKILASKIVFEGLVTANENFKILADGSIVAKNADISGNITIAGDWGGIKQGEGMTVYADGTTEKTTGIMMYGSAGEERPPFIIVTNRGVRLQGGDTTQLFVTDGRIGFSSILVANNDVAICWLSSAMDTTAYGMLRFTSDNRFRVGHSNFPTDIYGSEITFHGNMSGFIQSTLLWSGNMNTNTTASWSSQGDFVFYIVQGRPGPNSSSFVCAIIPGTMVYSDNQWQIADEANFTSFVLTSTSIKRVGGSGYLYRVFGIR